MKLNAPKQITWWIALVLTVVGLIGQLVESIPIAHPYAFWLVLVAAILLLLATYFEGL